MQIKILRPVLVAGAHVDEGLVLTVPADITAEDAGQLLRHGCAAETDAEFEDDAPKALADHTVSELKEIAAAEGVTLEDKAKKADIVEAIEKARAAAGNGA